MSLLGPSWFTLAGSVALAFAAGGVVGLFKGVDHQKDIYAIEAAKANAATLIAEREGARMAFRLQEKKDAESLRINDWLADALQRLRDRPGRLPRPSPAACEGATGAELSGPDGGFLEREAARAEELRNAIGQWQEWIVEVEKRRAAIKGATP